MRNLEEFNGKYTGLTAFIVASGPSISFLNLDPLRDFVTIAVNSGYIAIPDATFFISDDWSVANWSYFFNDLKCSQTTVLLYEDKLKQFAHMFGDRSVLFRHRRGYHVTDKYDHCNQDYHILQSRTSVGSAIHIAHIMGFKKIILLGVDCVRINDKRYFWQLNSHYVSPYRSDKRCFDNFKRIMHYGKQSDMDLLEISNYWNEFGSELNKKCEIYNASNISILSVFPKIDLPTFLESDNGRFK